MKYTRPAPPLPEIKNSGIIEELSEPINWLRPLRKDKVRADEADLNCGITLFPQFPDPEKLLETAYDEFLRLCNEFGIPATGNYQIITEKSPTRCKEAFSVCVEKDRCLIRAADTEGIRRGIYFVMDEILASSGPYMPLGKTERHPVVKTRISRCFYSPIKRPPRDNDQLSGDIDYYPEAYLSRLAWEGTNAVWLSIRFSEICKSPYVESFGQNAEPRLERLRDIVRRCRRYGIRVFTFCIEPEPLLKDDYRGHEDMLGARIAEKHSICVSTEKGRRHIEQCVYSLFSAVPELGGLINISVGERFTNCCSGVLPANCPRCSQKAPHEVVNDTLSAMKRGMEKAAPEAELISWPYTQYLLWGEEQTVDYAANATNDAVLQYNFSQGAAIEQLGKERRGVDYLLSYPYSSEFYQRCARARLEAGGRIGAKLQIANSHEVATVPFIPVPGNIYDQFEEIHSLGISLCMYCWFFGGYPSVMTKAAGELSFAPLPGRKEFLERLGRIYWGESATQAVKAWEYLEKGYRNFPITAVVGYYGPMHSGVVWPLHLNYENLPLTPNWLTLIQATGEELPPSGDRYGEYICFDYTTKEILELFSQMSDGWHRGLEILKTLPAPGELKKEQEIAETLDILFRSGTNITRFYMLRDELHSAGPSELDRRLELLGKMRDIAHEELELDKRLLVLAKEYSSLGYHGEAEGHKFHPALIEWRMEQLEHLLAIDFPEFEAKINTGKMLEEENKNKVSACCVKKSHAPDLSRGLEDDFWADVKPQTLNFQHRFKSGTRVLKYDKNNKESLDNSRSSSWRAAYTEDNLYIAVECMEPAMENVYAGYPLPEDNDSVCVNLEVKRCWPMLSVSSSVAGRRRHFGLYQHGDVKVQRFEDRWLAVFIIPMQDVYNLGFQGAKMRINILRGIPRADSTYAIQNWSLPAHSWFNRLIFGTVNPDDCGILYFKH